MEIDEGPSLLQSTRTSYENGNGGKENKTNKPTVVHLSQCMYLLFFMLGTDRQKAEREKRERWKRERERDRCKKKKTLFWAVDRSLHGHGPFPCLFVDVFLSIGSCRNE